MKLKAYHISHRKNKSSILANGIIPRAKTIGLIKYEPRIFFSINTEDLGFDFVGYDNVDCYEFEILPEDMIKDPFSSSENHFYTIKKISPSEITLIEL